MCPAGGPRVTAGISRQAVKTPRVQLEQGLRYNLSRIKMSETGKSLERKQEKKKKKPTDRFFGVY